MSIRRCLLEDSFYKLFFNHHIIFIHILSNLFKPKKMTKNKKKLSTTSIDNKIKITNKGSFLTHNQLTVLRCLCHNPSGPTKISRELKKPKSNIHRTMQDLISKGLVIKQEEHREYYPTIAGKEYMLSYLNKEPITKTPLDQRSDNAKLRFENVSVLLKILSKPKSWNRGRREIMMAKGIDYTEEKLNNNEILSYSLNDVFIKTMNDGIIVYLPSRLVKHSFLYWKVIFPILKRVVRNLQKEYNIRLSQRIVILCGEVADEKSAVAEIAKEVGDFFVWKDPVDEKTRFQIDKSKGFVEFETKHKLFQDADMTRINEFLLDICDNSNALLPSESTVKIEGHDSQIKDIERIQANMNELMNFQAQVNVETAQHTRANAENWRTHIGLMQDMRELIQRLNAKLK